jgi:ketosteroid isomerase-like protein
MRVLDVGCGPGDVSFLAAELVGSRGSVVGKRQTGVGVTHSIHDHASVLASIPLRAILRGAMTDQPTTPDLVELGSRLLEAANRRDLDAALRFYAPDAVVENAQGLGTFEGKAAIRDFWQDWLASYGELWLEREEVLDLGHGLVFSVFLMRGRPVGSSRLVELRYAGVGTWRDGLIVRTMFSTDIDNARAAAERLAQE